MKDEIELKLILAAQDLHRLRRHGLVRTHRLGRATTRSLDNLYYDTPDHSLLRDGASLRVRRIGRQRLQTVKLRNGAGGNGHFDRQEWEEPLETDAPQTESLAPTPVPALLGEAGMAALTPLFATRFRRTTYQLAEDPAHPERGWHIELTLDEGTVEAADRCAPLVEAELELVRGSASDLYRLAAGLVDGLPARLGSRSKADRGYALVADTPAKAPKAERPGLRRKMTAAKAFQAIGHACLRHYFSAETALHDARTPEGIHQMRVALRRLRSAMTLFGPLVATEDGLRLKAEIKWLAGELGEARDGDVFLTEVLAPVQADHPEDAGLALLGRHMADLRDAGYDRAYAAAGGPRAIRLLLDLALWLDAGDWLARAEEKEIGGRKVVDVAAEVLDRRARKVAKIGRHFARLDADQRHALRIEVKKLRYAVEFFRPLFKGKTGKAYQKAAARLQDGLGSLNDIAVAEERLHSLTVAAEVAGGQAGRDAAFAAGRVTGWHGARGQALLEETAAAWTAFAALPPFWR